MSFSRTCLLSVAFLVLAGCGTDEPVVAGTPTPTPTSSTPTPTPSKTVTTTPATDVVVDVTIANGKVSATKPVIEAKSGQSVLINAVSDVADSLHVHGYDETIDLKPGKPGSVSFKADTKGIFEVETHESGKLAFKLQVS